MGLLLIRFLVGIAAIRGCAILCSGALLGPTLLAFFSMILGLLLIVGLWTPVAGALIAATAVWTAFTHASDAWYFAIVGVLGLALALIGPGSWSVDAWLFGWRRL